MSKSKSKSTAPVSDALRRIIKECGMSRYEIAQRSGVEQAALSRFVSGERGLWTITLDRLFPVLGLKIVTTKSTK